jgi:dTDP-4-dehydrorhamnose 3,5-epimerase
MSLLKLLPTELEGVSILQPRIFEDQRGSFIKTYHTGMFRELGLDFAPKEEFFSVSRKDVVRGMHFQVPPMAQAKVVYCIAGRILDVVVDLRRGSRTFGRWFERELNETNREMVFMAAGFAHGFLALMDNAVTVYQAGEVHSPQHDVGILWNSFGFHWPVKNPIISERDRGFPALRDFVSPF